MGRLCWQPHGINLRPTVLVDRGQMGELGAFEDVSVLIGDRGLGHQMRSIKRENRPESGAIT